MSVTVDRLNHVPGLDLYVRADILIIASHRHDHREVAEFVVVAGRVGDRTVAFPVLDDQSDQPSGSIIAIAAQGRVDFVPRFESVVFASRVDIIYRVSVGGITPNTINTWVYYYQPIQQFPLRSY